MTLDTDSPNTSEYAYNQNPYVQIESTTTDPNLTNLVDTLRISSQVLPVFGRFARQARQNPEFTMLNPHSGDLHPDSPLMHLNLIREVVGISSCVPYLYEAQKELLDHQNSGATNLADQLVIMDHLLRKNLGQFYDITLTKKHTLMLKEKGNSKSRFEVASFDDFATFLSLRTAQISRFFPSDDTDNMFIQNPSRRQIDSWEEADAFKESLRDVNHDLKIPIQIIHGALDSVADLKQDNLLDEEIITTFSNLLPRGVDSVDKAIQNAVDKIVSKYPVDKLSWQDINSIFGDWAIDLDGQNIELQIDDSLLQHREPTYWSSAWFTALLGNILQNAIKGYRDRDLNLQEQDPNLQEFPKKTISISTRVVELENGKYRDYVIRDQNLRGMPGKIVVGGFGRYTSEWQGQEGTGTGMNNHRQTLEEQYGGFLLGRVVRDPNTGEILGAETVIRLPIQD